jgi:hypothetical protein
VTRPRRGALRRALPLAAFLAAGGALLPGCSAEEPGGEAPGGTPPVGAAGVQEIAGTPPAFEVDPSWPREMPDDWIFGSITAVFVDDRDHVWVTHLPETLTPEETGAVQDPPIGTCCRPAPTVVEFDPQGQVVQGWGDPGEDLATYPRNPHGLFIDHQGFVWIGTYLHHRVMKFTREGEHVLTLGEYDVTGGSDHPELLGGPAAVWVDPSTNEAFVADGYRNRRVVVFDAETGAYLRHWGAYGDPPDDDHDFGDRDPEGPPPLAFSTVHDLVGSRDGLIYVADRRGTGSRSSDRTGASWRSASWPPRPGPRGPPSSWPFPRTGRNVGSTWPTAPTTRSGSSAGRTWRSSGSWGGGDARWASSSGPTGMDVDSQGTCTWVKPPPDAASSASSSGVEGEGRVPGSDLRPSAATPPRPVPP